MSEAQTRPSNPRGRGSHRGAGRGGYSSRGGRGGNRQINGTKSEIAPDSTSIDDGGEIGQLKKTYASKVSTVKEMFPDWTDEDIVYALQENDGDLETTIERISEGNISQFSEVKKKVKDRSQSKVKEPAGVSSEGGTSASTRGGRGRGGFENGRGGRGRGSDRGRSATRGGRGGLTNGARNIAKPEEVPTAESVSWDTPAAVDPGTPSWDTPAAPETATPSWDSAVAENTSLDSGWENISAADATRSPPTEQVQPSSKPDGTRSWASMFSKPKPAPAAPKAPRSAPSHEAPIEPSIEATSMPAETDIVGLPPPPINEGLEIPSTPPTSDLASSEPPANITPSKDELTETNLEQVPDVSGAPATATAASTIASTVDPQISTPGQGSQQQSSSRPALGGYATSAYKATGIGGPGRSASFQRKIMEQQEAVVMPGKHAVDRAAVQFGSMGLNGSTDDVDVDSDREDAETRAQPPQHSPIAPRAALPPAPQHQSFASQAQMEPLPTPRQAPGLPPPGQPSAIQQPTQGLPSESAASQQPSQSNYPYGNQYNNRYGSQPSQQEVSAPAQKAYEPFGQQIQQPQQYDGYPSTSQAQSQPQHQAPSAQGAFSSAPNDTPSYYTSDSQRNAYQNFYGSYGQQAQPNAQDTGASQQRGTTFGASAQEASSQFPTSQSQPQGPSRFNQAAEAQNSGHSTPNPSLSGQQQPNQPHHMMPPQGQGQAGGQHGAYPYNHPYYASQYYGAYMNQYGYNGGQGGYGGGPFGSAGGKQGMYGQPHQGYGMSPQTSYDQHSSSPANAGAFGQQHSASGRDSAAPGGLSSYGRTGSTQPPETPQQFPGAGASNHGSVPDAFGRSSTGFSGQSSGLGSHMSQQAGSDDRYGDASKGAGGPSPALGQPGARPGSTANAPGQTGLPPSQGHNQSHQGYSGYMGQQMHGQQGSQYGAGPGGHHQYGGQNHQAGGYGGYGGGYGGSSYGSNRGGWGANYGH
ncbi:hypothetical protein P7C71_g4241, partial [Lecanoromycetidae sp. Uapishka_2]